MVKRVFIYGRFVEDQSLPESLYGLTPPPRLEPELATEAIEILREFSPLEMIGKIHVLNRSRNYEAVTPSGARDYTWFKDYRISRFEKKRFFFEIKGGEQWQVLWMHQESDDSGPYMAVALKHDQVE